MAEVALIAVAVLAVVLGGFLAALGTEAPASGSYAVSGTVFERVAGGGVLPAVGASVVLTDESPTHQTVLTSASGGFSFSGVPTGGISLNITQPGYAAVSLVTFASSVYDAGTTGLSVTLTPGSSANVTTLALTPFPDLESFLASIGSGVLLLGLVAVVGGVAAVVTARSDRPAVGVVGGAAGVLAPLALYFLALGGVFPTLISGSAVLAAVGAFAVTTRTFEIYQMGPESRGA